MSSESDRTKRTKANQAELDQRIEERFPISCFPLEYQQSGDRWVARKGSFLGCGNTPEEALEDLHKKLALHFGN